MLAEEMEIGRTAALFGVSLRTLRFYEDRGLIKPIRRGTARYYTSGDHVRLQLIATGKKLGLSLSQIADLIGQAAMENSKEQGEVGANDASSIVDLLSKDEIQQQLQILERQKADLEVSIAELKTVVAADEKSSQGTASAD